MRGHRVSRGGLYQNRYRGISDVPVGTDIILI
jgi:hypothetical protein